MQSTASPSASTSQRTIRIVSRKSQLALIQTYWVRDELKKHYPDFAFEVVTMDTQGDKVLDVSLSKIGDKGLFTQELENSLLRGDSDFAVHSLKDLPTRLPDRVDVGLHYGARRSSGCSGDAREKSR
jgi:hydroxymethylbilane synthase